MFSKLFTVFAVFSFLACAFAAPIPAALPPSPAPIDVIEEICTKYGVESVECHDAIRFSPQPDIERRGILSDLIGSVLEPVEGIIKPIEGIVEKVPIIGGLFDGILGSLGGMGAGVMM